MTGRWSRALGRGVLLALTLCAALALSGCRGTVYDEGIPTPGGIGPAGGINPAWIVIGLLFFGLLGPILNVLLVIVLLPIIFPPFHAVKIGRLKIELWKSQRKFPYLSLPAGLIVPVAPDLKMVFGVAKLIRDFGASKVQYEANSVAPLKPGDAFVGSGARFRYGHTALAVVFDELKRTNPQIMAQALRTAIRKLGDEGAASVMVPDMTENLLQQPNWITDEQRQSTARATARLMLDAIVAAQENNTPVRTVKIWCWDPANVDAFVEEMDRMAEEAHSDHDLNPATSPTTATPVSERG